MSDSSYLQTKATLPRVVVIGRANVGKSTLFNRLTGTRRAITDPTAGVTRDPVTSTCTIGRWRVELTDTGGFRNESTGLESIVSDRSIEAMRAADVVLLLVDVNGATPEDEELIELVRPFAQRTVLVANKADDQAKDSLAWEFYAYGFSRVVPVSAEHKRNFEDLIGSIEELLRAWHETGRVTAARADGRDTLGSSAFEERAGSYNPIEEDTGEIIRLALLGKPNTGKSTLLNKLLDKERSIVSDTPGTTRDVIEGRFTFRDIEFRVLDTAGIRRKRSVSESLEYYSVNRAIGSIQNSDVVILVVDALDGITEQDKKISSQVIKHQRGIVLAFNKWDKYAHISNAENAVRDRTRYLFPVLSFAPFVPVSARDGTGIRTLLNASVRVWKQMHTEISTGRLNRSLQKWIQHYAPPHGSGPRYAVRYMTQISTNPVRFVAFVNRVHGFPDSWISYAQNRMREEFELDVVPFSIELRES